MQHSQTLTKHVTLVVGIAAFTVGTAVLGNSSLRASGRPSWAWAMLAGMAGAATLAIVVMKATAHLEPQTPARKPGFAVIAPITIVGVAAAHYSTPSVVAAVMPGLLTFLLTVGSAALLDRLRAKRKLTNPVSVPGAADRPAF